MDVTLITLRSLDQQIVEYRLHRLSHVVFVCQAYAYQSQGVVDKWDMKYLVVTKNTSKHYAGKLKSIQ